MDNTLKDDLEAFKHVSDAEKDQRTEMLDDLKFVKLGEQWPENVIDKRKKEGRPCLVINRLPAFAKQVTNDARQNRPAIKCHGVAQEADEETAEILDGLIKNIEYSSNADIAYDTALDFAVNCGVGYWTVDIDYADADTFEKDIKINRIGNPFSVYGDPASKEADSSDWNSAFIIETYTEPEFKKRWPNASLATFESDDKTAGWYEEENVRVAERWIREKKAVKLLKLTNGSLMMEPEFLKLKDILDAQGIGVEGERETWQHFVKQRIISGAEILENNDWPGKYIPIVPCYGDEVNIDGKRSFQSLFKFSKDAQRNYNYWRTATTELVALAPKVPFIGPAGAFDTDAEKWATANVESHPYIQYDGPQQPQRQPFAGPPAGALQEALNASDDLKNIMGLHDASLGARSNETSGRAILARQREGDISTFNFVDNQSRAIRHTGRILVDLIPKVYDVARIIRVLKEDGTSYSVPVNQPVQEVQQRPDPQNPNKQGPPQYQPIDPEQQAEINGVIKTFDLKAGKYDVTCEAGPSFTTRREESAEQMMQFVQSFPQSAPLIGDLIAKALDWEGADEIAKRLQAMLPPQAQGQNPQLQQAEQAIQQLKQQIGQMGQALEDKKTEYQLRQNELNIKAQETQVKMFDADTKRLQITKPDQQQPVDNSFEAFKQQMTDELTRWKTEQDNATKILIKQMDIESTAIQQAAIDDAGEDLTEVKE